ncbi:carboxyl transferase domain-containing protein [uncultured Paraglaciecola sp.]|uniref:carboxyl transferase domain-containing protein n=1 Tax=uncultured Paraglaciecola sp. TaxID=1765024 RepID=UPI0030DCF6F4|tara:strand:+ start:18755 stop:20542 length:1788 start_codon:yes stop_codon:yes gene_type:complete
MASNHTLNAPNKGSVVAVLVTQNQQVRLDQPLVIIEAMKMQTTLCADVSGQVSQVFVKIGDDCEVGMPVVELCADGASDTKSNKTVNNNSTNLRLLDHLYARKALTLDEQRIEQQQKRHQKGYLSARENLQNLCSLDSFMEYGQLAVAAQRLRRDYDDLKLATAADGVITGIGQINQGLVAKENTPAAIVINDYSVLAGTQGYFHHLKLDRILDIAADKKYPVVMFTEGGGGRPGDTDITTVNSGLQCQSFATWASLQGKVPRIAVANGYCFAGNAALFGAADITIATHSSWIGMAGPAMIEGGGLGVVNPTDIGPSANQFKNGVIDILVENEQQAANMAKKCLAYFQGPLLDGQACSFADQQTINHVLPEDRRFVYDVKDIINIIADTDSFTEIKSQFGAAIITGFMHLQGHPVGVIASNCKVLGGAIDIDAGEKASQFMQLCQQFAIPLVVLCDTPGFMVGPEHEDRGAVRRLSHLFVAGSQLSVPLVAVVLRKCYGLGAQALLGGNTSKPSYTMAWPTGEFGGMGLEGAVKLGFKKELAQVSDPSARTALYEKLLAEQYQKGQAQEVASVLEIDAVIAPEETRQMLILALLG